VCVCVCVCVGGLRFVLPTNCLSILFISIVTTQTGLGFPNCSDWTGCRSLKLISIVLCCARFSLSFFFESYARMRGQVYRECFCINCVLLMSWENCLWLCNLHSKPIIHSITYGSNPVCPCTLLSRFLVESIWSETRLLHCINPQYSSAGISTASITASLTCVAFLDLSILRSQISYSQLV